MICKGCLIDKNDKNDFFYRASGRLIAKYCKKCYGLKYKEKRIKYRKEHPEMVKESKKRDYEKNIITYMLSGARRRAKERGLEFNIGPEDIAIPEFCPILDIKIEAKAGMGRSGNAPSIDRVDNSKGYTKDNILIVSDRANSLKKDSTEEERKLMFDFYKKLMMEQILNFNKEEK